MADLRECLAGMTEGVIPLDGEHWLLTVSKR